MDIFESENELYHYGVKGMRWGVRRSPAQLGSSSRDKLTARAEKAHQKQTTKDEKWAQKKVNKGKAEKVIRNHERLQTARNMEQVEKGVALRTAQFDKMVEKRMKSDPNFKENMSSKEKAYLERKAANNVLAKNVLVISAKQRAVEVAVDTAKNKYSKEKPNSNPTNVEFGAEIAKLFMTSAFAKAEKQNINALSFTKTYETSQRRVNAVNQELAKRETAG